MFEGILCQKTLTLSLCVLNSLIMSQTFVSSVTLGQTVEVLDTCKIGDTTEYQ